MEEHEFPLAGFSKLSLCIKKEKKKILMFTLLPDSVIPDLPLEAPATPSAVRCSLGLLEMQAGYNNEDHSKQSRMSPALLRPGTRALAAKQRGHKGTQGVTAFPVGS